MAEKRNDLTIFGSIVLLLVYCIIQIVVTFFPVIVEIEVGMGSLSSIIIRLISTIALVKIYAHKSEAIFKLPSERIHLDAKSIIPLCILTFGIGRVASQMSDIINRIYPMNNVELKLKVYSVANNLMKEKNYIAPIDVQMGVGILSIKDYERWRFGQVPYLEKICKSNLSKLSFIMKEIKTYAVKNHLKPSWTVYNQWGVKGRKILLRFSKSSDSMIEKAYATHYIATGYQSFDV